MNLKENVEDIPPSSFKTRVKVETIMLFALGILTVIQVMWKDAFAAFMEPFVRNISFVIAASVAALLPGIVYKGGEWYVKFFRGEHFISREKAFTVFVIEVGIAVGLAILVQ